MSFKPHVPEPVKASPSDNVTTVKRTGISRPAVPVAQRNVINDDLLQPDMGRKRVESPFQLKPRQAGAGMRLFQLKNISGKGVIQYHRVVLPDGQETEVKLKQIKKDSKDIYKKIKEKGYKIKQKFLYVDDAKTFLYVIHSRKGNSFAFKKLCKYDGTQIELQIEEDEVKETKTPQNSIESESSNSESEKEEQQPIATISTNIQSPGISGDSEDGRESEEIEETVTSKPSAKKIITDSSEDSDEEKEPEKQKNSPTISISSSKEEAKPQVKGSNEKEPVKKTIPVKPQTKFVVSIALEEIDFGQFNPNPAIAQINIPASRPEGTSGEKHGGHLTAWVAFSSELAQCIHPGMQVTTAIENVRKLVYQYFSLPGHFRKEYLYGRYLKLYIETYNELKKLYLLTEIAPEYRVRYLETLATAYLNARNAIPFTAVATKDNKGKGESTIQEKLWEIETKGGVENKSINHDFYAAGLLWCLFDADSANEYAEQDVKALTGNFTDISPAKSKPFEKFDSKKMSTWSSYQRRMGGALTQHIITMKSAYPIAAGIAKLGSNVSLEVLKEYFKDNSSFKKRLGINSKSSYSWELELDISTEDLIKIIETMTGVGQENNPFKGK